MNLGKKVVAIGGAGGTSGPIAAANITDAGTAGIAVLQSETKAQVREAAGVIPAVSASVFPELVNISCFGDSLTTGTGSAVSYPQTLEALSGFACTNAGVGGETTASIAARYIAATSRHADSLILWAGRNDIGVSSTQTVLDGIAAAIAAAGHNRFIVVGVTTMANETAPNKAQIAEINSSLAATYGVRFFDALAYLLGSALADSGIAPNSTSLNDIANGITPSQLRSDAIHLNATGYSAIANKVFEYFIQAFLGGTDKGSPGIIGERTKTPRAGYCKALYVGTPATKLEQSSNGSFMFNKGLLPSTDGGASIGYSSSGYRWLNAYFSGDVWCKALVQQNTTTPASATATGTKGTIVWDDGYLYVCTATNTWKRAALSTW